MAEQPERRFFVAIAYQAGRDSRIKKGADGRRDYFTADELEKAAHSFLRNGPKGGTFHIDGTEGAVEYVESWIHRWDPQHVTAVDGSVTVVKAGDWLVAGYMDPGAWALFKSGKITGVSPQGSANAGPAEE